MRRSNGEVVIIYDMFELVRGYGKSLGIYLYAIELLKELLLLIPDGYRLVVIGNSLNESDLNFVKNCQKAILDIRSISKMNSLIKLEWEFFGASRTINRYAAQCYYSPKGFGPGLLNPPKGCRVVLTIHDMIPQWYIENSKKNGLLERFVSWSIRRSIRWAHHIVAISEATKSDIVRYEPEMHDKISVIYDGMMQPIDPALPSVSGKYFFSLVSVLPHKNSMMVIDAWNRYREISSDPIPLVVCGKLQVPSDIIQVSGLSYPELAAMYAYAEMFVTSSWIEGFGLPPLEAMQQGTIVAASDIPAHREILGDVAYFFSPNSIDDLVKLFFAIERGDILKNPDLSTGQAAKYSWKIAATGIWEKLSELN